MKTLFFCRHAKSDWSTALPDHDRPLNDRGIKSAPLMAKVWQDQDTVPLFWISSSARRALQTAQLMLAEYTDSIALQVDHHLYHADVKSWLETIHALPNAQNAVALFGHNPGITDIVNVLSGSDISNIPTCGLAKITFRFDDWELISKGIGTLEWFEYPKKHGAF